MELPVRAWRVYCSSGQPYTSNPSAIPPDVQVVIFFHDYPYRTLAYGEDFYEVDGVTLVGKEIPESDYYRVVDTALADMEWPV